MTELTRRAMLGGVAAGLAATAGCLDVITGDEPLEIASDPASVPESTLESTGYELVSENSPTISEEFTAAGQTREVEVTNHVASYEKTVDIGPLESVKAAMFSVFSTPQIDIATRTFNPVGEMSNRQLLKQIASRYDGLTVDEKVDEKEESALDQTVTVERYEGTTEMEGREVPIYLLITRAEHEEDYVVMVGGYPQQLDGEESDIYTLIRNVEH